MELIDDLGTDLAVAILVERRLEDRLEDLEAISLIGRVRNALLQISDSGKPSEESAGLAVCAGSGL